MILKKIVIKCFVVFSTAIIFFLIHLTVNHLINQAVSINQLIYSYSINVILACGVITIIFLLKNKLKDMLGFVFMATSVLKFVFFFILFYPQYTFDGDLSRTEFFIFFIPYVVCLVTESVILSKFLNRLENFKA